MKVRGYKVALPDYKSRNGNEKWKVGKTYKYDGCIKLCKAGFHFCQKIQNCFSCLRY